jgi:hypothetical protein
VVAQSAANVMHVTRRPSLRALARRSPLSPCPPGLAWPGLTCRRGLRLRAYGGYTTADFAADYSGLTLTFDQVQPTVDCPTLPTCLALADDETSNWAAQVSGAVTAAPAARPAVSGCLPAYVQAGRQACRQAATLISQGTAHPRIYPPTHPTPPRCSSLATCWCHTRTPHTPYTLHPTTAHAWFGQTPARSWCQTP